MKKILRTRTITKTSKRIVVCHENFRAVTENLEALPAICPNCGEPILPPKTLQLPAAQISEPELPGGFLTKAETDEA